MHLLATNSTSLDEIVEPVDLAQPPGDIAVLSFADSDLAGLAAAWAVERDALPSVRLAQLRDLKHPMSVDLWIERVGAHAKGIVVRLLGGLDWGRYGVERPPALARARGIAPPGLPGGGPAGPRPAESPPPRAGGAPRHRARGAAGRGRRRPAAGRSLHARCGRARHLAAVLPRGRPAEPRRAAAPAGTPRRRRGRGAAAPQRAPPRRLSAGPRRD